MIKRALLSALIVLVLAAPVGYRNARAQVPTYLLTYNYTNTNGANYNPFVFDIDPGGSGCISVNPGAPVWDYGCGSLAIPQSPRFARFVWNWPVDVYIVSVTISGGHTAPHYGTVALTVTNTGYSTGSSITIRSDTSSDPSAYDTIPVGLMTHSLDITRYTTGSDPGPFNRDFVSDVSIVYSYAPPSASPTAVASATLPPTWTPGATFTPRQFPTFTPSPTPIPANTRVGAPPTAIPSLDTCANLSNPCGTLAVFPTLIFPTLDLASPTQYPIRSTPTPRPITATPQPSATPSMSATPTQQIAASITPQATPISMLLTPTSQFIDPLLALSGSVGSYQATAQSLIDAGNVTVNGTPQGIIGLAAQLGGGIAQPIRIARMLEMTDLNRVGGFITFLLILIAGEIMLSISGIIIPVVSRLISWAISIGQFIAQVIGGIVSAVRSLI